MGTILDRRRVYGHKSLLPSGYKQLEYIENTSNAYIDTGFVPSVNSHSKVVAKFNILKSFQVSGVYIGESGSIAASGFDVFGVRPYGSWFLRAFTDSLPYSESWQTDTNVHIFVSDAANHSVSVDGISIQRTAQHTSTNLSVFLFLRNEHTGARYPCYARVYSAKLYDSNTLIRNFIPCLSSDNKVGMYDTITKSFFKSPNGTAFVAGPEV